MSWSVSAIGKPENVAEYLEKQSASMSPGQSKDEYDAALPHMLGLVKQNYTSPDHTYPQPLISLTAQGSGTTSSVKNAETGAYDIKEMNRSCSCKIEILYGTLV